MGNDFVALFLNVSILVLLGATIIYVYRLTKSLDNFKEHRRQLDSVIANLLSSIDQAERSVLALKQSSAENAGELEHLIAQAKGLSDELQIINEAGESMAKRLEKLAETNRKIVQPSHKIPDYAQFDDGEKISSPVHRSKVGAQKKMTKERYDSTLKRVDKGQSAEGGDFPSFMIQDRDFEDMDSLGNRLDSSVSNDGRDAASDDEPMPDNLKSQAERELFDALRSGKKNISKRGS